MNTIRLPILDRKEAILEAVIDNQVVIIVGETGSGKTTQSPQFIFKFDLGLPGKIGITQPRRIAATSVAHFVADQLGCNVGENVGYKIRFDDSTAEGTSIKFMTDGILLREMQADPLLSEYSVIMVDEAHERSLNMDFLLGLLKRLLKQRSDLKLIISSATIEEEKFSRYFSGAPVINVSGRTYPVDIHYTETVRSGSDDMPSAIVDKIVELIEQIHQSTETGDILIFLTGEDVITRVVESIKERQIPRLICLPLYGNMNFEEQTKVFQRFRERKVVVATNIAETSVTIDGIVYVVDSGLEKRIGFNPKTGIQNLDVTPVSKASASQRAGRAGRTRPGICYRLYSRDDFNQREEYTTPEIQRTDLAGVVLQMKSLGITDIVHFDFIDPPDKEAFDAAYKTLIILGALDKDNGLTQIGRLMASLPLEPRIARMLIAAREYGCIDEICTIAASLSSIRPVFNRPKEKQWEADMAHRQFRDKVSDFLTLLNVYNAYECSGYDDSWCYQNFLNARVLMETRSIKKQLTEILWQSGIAGSSANAKTEIVSKAVAAGLVEHIFQDSEYHALDGGDKGTVYIHPGSAIFGQRVNWMVAASIVETSKRFARNCAIIEPEWILEIAPQLCHSTITPVGYSKWRRKVEATRHICFRRVEIKRETVWLSVDEFKETQEKLIAEAEAKEWIKLIFNRKPKEYAFEFRDRWISIAGGKTYEDASYSDEPIRGRTYYCSVKYSLSGTTMVQREFEVIKLEA